VDEVWETLDRVLDECLAVSLWAQPDSIVVGELDRLAVAARKVAAATLLRIREIDGRGVPAAQGATSTLAWLRDRYRISGREAARQVRLARALEASATADALAAGAVNVEQAQVITDAVAKVPAEHRTAAEEHLLGEAGTFGPKGVGPARPAPV
jgi:hypothetical protein